jgi:4a-hydroxytetrahydrobiopterin dehydratase
MKLSPLPEPEIRSKLETLPDWTLNPKGEITKTFEFKDFAHALLFVNSVGYFSEKMDHHPDIDIRWNKVTLTLISHSAKGLTQLDFTLAGQVDRYLAK